MANIFKSGIILFYFLFLFSVDFKLSKQIDPYKMSIKKNNIDLEIYNINYNDSNIHCEILVPSLFTPIFLINPQKKSGEEIKEIEVVSPVINLKKKITIYLFDYTFETYGNAILGVERITNLLGDKCYFGLSSKKANYNSLNDTFILLKKMNENKKINKKIFSFDNWTLDDDNFLYTTFYLGDEHYNFLKNNKEGIIGECKVKEDYDFWGCFFTGMSVNGITKDLKRENNTGYYNVYFSTETHDIIFPIDFLTKFEELTGCSYDPDINNYAICDNLFNDQEYATLKLISDKMIITIEIDNQNRFCEYNEDKKTLSRIKFEVIDYFVLPLIMFKRFDIQFDAENDRIQFYTKNSSLLEIKKEKGNNSSKAGIVFLIIFIIILIIALGFGGFWFLKKRRGSVEKNINKYNKFDEDENFQNMNEKRVF